MSLWGSFLEQHRIHAAAWFIPTVHHTLHTTTPTFRYFFLSCHVSVVTIVTGLRAVRSGIRISAGAKDFSLLWIQTGPVALPASYSVHTGGSYPEGKAARALCWLVTFFSCFSWVSGGILPLPLYAFMACVGKLYLYHVTRFAKFCMSILSFS